MKPLSARLGLKLLLSGWPRLRICNSEISAGEGVHQQQAGLGPYLDVMCVQLQVRVLVYIVCKRAASVTGAHTHTHTHTQPKLSTRTRLLADIGVQLLTGLAQRVVDPGGHECGLV